jgi:hypothetical protein
MVGVVLAAIGKPNAAAYLGVAAVLFTMGATAETQRTGDVHVPRADA